MFYQQLNKICKVNNTTVTALAKEFGMSTGNVTRWKNGGTPSIELLIKIAKHFNVTTDYLLGLDDRKYSDNAIISKAKELGELILQSEEYQNMKKAEALQEADDTAREILRNYSEKRASIMDSAKSRRLDANEIKELERKIADEYENITKNTVVSGYINARAAYEELVDTVNNIINFYVTGEEDGCNGEKCSGCGGCGGR